MKKGFSLVEVIVALAFFAITFGAIITCYLLGVKAYNKQEEYLYFESICLDIDKLYDKDDATWQNEYFNSISDKYYYNSEYKLVNNEDKYTLSIKEENNNLIISVYNNYNNYYVIENLNYGPGGSN